MMDELKKTGKKLLIPALACMASLSNGCGSLPVKEYPGNQSGITPEGKKCLTLTTSHRTFFKLDENRNTESYIKDGKKFYKVDECILIEHRQFVPAETMLVVMDPWEEVGNEKLNNHGRKVFDNALYPLVKKCIELGIGVTVLTNAKDAEGYGYDIFSELADLKKQGKLDVIYHSECTAEAFARSLREKGVRNLIYCGYYTNMCVIARQLGIITMNQYGFRMYLAPDAACAIESGDTWEGQEIHKYTTIALSQWAVELIDVKEVLAQTPLQ